jgi:hypothetical protein
MRAKTTHSFRHERSTVGRPRAPAAADVLPIGVARSGPPVGCDSPEAQSGAGDGQCWSRKASVAVRFWERNGSGEARSNDVRRGDRDRR